VRSDERAGRHVLRRLRRALLASPIDEEEFTGTFAISAPAIAEVHEGTAHDAAASGSPRRLLPSGEGIRVRRGTRDVVAQRNGQVRADEARRDQRERKQRGGDHGGEAQANPVG